MTQMRKIAVLIKTCSGRPSLLWVIHSVIHGLREFDVRIYIADEKPVDLWKQRIYESLEEDGHHIELLEPGTGVGKARNLLVESLNEEELVLRMDDDFELGGEFNLKAMITILQMSNEIGYCGDLERQIGEGKSIRSGQIRPAGGDLILKPPTIIKKFHRPFKKHNLYSGVRYSIAGHTRNLLLLKRDVVEQVKWNEKLLFQGEHLDFMLAIREAGFKGAYTPDSTHYHRDDLASMRYMKSPNGNLDGIERPGESEMAEVYQKRWGCSRVKSTYPLSWYMVEGGRTLLEKFLT